MMGPFLFSRENFLEKRTWHLQDVQHKDPEGRNGRVYVINPKPPVAYPESGVVCGRGNCDNPAKIWIDESELQKYMAGARVFGFNSN